MFREILSIPGLWPSLLVTSADNVAYIHDTTDDLTSNVISSINAGLLSFVLCGNCFTCYSIDISENFR